MKLISDIINELIDSEKSIESPLLKTKVLASRLQNNTLFEWVSSELTGYLDEAQLPNYRKYTGFIKGTFIYGNVQYNNQQIPTAGIPQEAEESIRAINFTQGVAALEKIKQGCTTGTLVYPFRAELTGLLQANWIKMGNPFLRVINSNKSISVNAIDEILSYVRNNLLDFMLKIDNEFGNITEIEEMKKNKQQIETILNQTIIHNNGDGSIINTGDNSEFNTKINILKGNKDSLSNYLKNIGVSEEMVSNLTDFIDSETIDKETGTFGPKVNSWIQVMIGKALNGSWNIGIGAAGNLLAEAIKMYYLQ